MPDGYLTVAKIAEMLKLTPQRVRRLIHERGIQVEEVGRVLLIKTEDLERLKKRKPGRPKRKEEKAGE